MLRGPVWMAGTPHETLGAGECARNLPERFGVRRKPCSLERRIFLCGTHGERLLWCTRKEECLESLSAGSNSVLTRLRRCRDNGTLPGTAIGLADQERSYLEMS